MSSEHDETRPLLALSDVDDVGSGEGTAKGDAPKKTPLPKLQLSILTLVHVTEAISGYCIFPFINQVRYPRHQYVCDGFLIQLVAAC